MENHLDKKKDNKVNAPWVFKIFFTGLVLLATLVYAAWKNMQTPAIFSLVLLICLIYRSHLLKVFDIVLSLLRKTKQAKIGNVEVNLSDSWKQSIADTIVTNKAWVKPMLSNLTAEEMNFLLLINKAGKFKTSDAVKDTLRGLRAKGLLQHNNKTMANATEAWLTELGIELVDIITKPTSN